MRHAQIRRLSAAWLAGLLSLTSGVAPATGDVRIPGFELVHNAPVGAGLDTPDIRDPVTVWCAMIDAARERIDFEQYYAAAQPGEPLDTVIAHIEKAAARGVRIRFLMEKKGLSASTPATIERLRRIPGLDFRLLAFSDLAGEGIIHAKYFVVDGVAAYVGSQNFDWRSLTHIDETGLAIDDPAIVAQLGAIFEQDWQAQQRIEAGRPVPATAAAPSLPPPSGSYIVASPARFNPPGVIDSEGELVRLLGTAQREVRIEVMEYAPLAFKSGYYGVIDQAIRTAAQRGVAIKLLVADWNLTPAKVPYLKSLAVLPNIEVRVVTIPQDASGFIPFARVVHTKTMAIDDGVAWIGTSNWEGGYLDTSRNIEVVVRDPLMAKRVAALHEQLWSSRYARPIDINRAYVAPRPGGATP